ncbi:SpoIIE family protein phosphatase [Cellulomonas carbonis]|uniref:Stage II sporulation protein E n=1 Tax=Cellulomonas carbonis T26 TaxID=947969 RepID=A0A0A0BN64_9CELL|nr:SpoIIE family protein phosphatase [Cellulomonas carbonis]KGM09401.1 stage II sporulation protein E [Cellulomonas carbonis T26]GGC01071.1 hypothetical protein GCM10010972_12330 [Cellulomonas carbonis]
MDESHRSAPDGSPRASDPRAGAALPALVHDRPTATLLVDLGTGQVVYANPLAVDLAPDATLPVSLGEWSRAAELRTPDGVPLEDGRHGLSDVAHGEPPRGMQVHAAHGSGESAPGEALWVIGIPLGEAPAPLTHQALVILLPVRQHDAVRALQETGDDLHARAALASELSFTISDPRLPDDPIVWVNPAFERVTGYSSAEALGRNCRFLQGPDTDRALVEEIRGALAEGRTFADVLLNYRKDGTPFWNQVVISPVLDAQGRITHHVGIQADVTDRVVAQHHRDDALHEARTVSNRLQLLAQVSEELAAHLDYDDAVRALSDVVVPRLATWGFVTVTTDGGLYERVHIAVRDPEKEADARALEREDLSWLRRSSAMTRALRAEGAGIVPVATDAEELRGRTTPSQHELLVRLGLGHAIIVPLRARDRVIGALCLVDTQPFPDDVVETASHLSGRAGLALDNVNLYIRERAAALTLQHSLLPELPDVPGLDLSASYLPALHRAQVGGDWFDVLPLPDGAIGLAVGDVVGHDLQAAASMGQLRSVLRSYAWSGEPAHRVISRLDELVQGLGMADMSTCVYLRLEGDRLSYSRAGHPPALLREPDGTVRLLEGALGTPIGVANLAEAPEVDTTLPVGATLVVYTDGLVERRDRGLREGIAELVRVLEGLPPDLTAREVRDALVGALVGQDQEDDVCVLVVRRT